METKTFRDPIPGQLAYSVPQFCKLSSFGSTRVYEFLKSGILRGKKIGKRTVITHEEAVRFFNEAEDYLEHEERTKGVA